jgi:hypothetical protein
MRLLQARADLEEAQEREAQLRREVLPQADEVATANQL